MSSSTEAVRSDPSTLDQILLLGLHLDEFLMVMLSMPSLYGDVGMVYDLFLEEY